MCGINGIIGENEKIVRGMNDATLHRGPDRQGVHALPGATIGNNRLAIIDISESGNQPMTSQSGKSTIVFNGEIYNYIELKKILIEQGVSFRGNSDTEVIVEAYEMWGKSLVDRLRGMWAFCIYDHATKELFISRDPFGIKPLYLYNDGSTIAFSSEIRGLLAHPHVKRDIDDEAVRDLLFLGYIVAPKTILRFASSLVPGESKVIAADGTVKSSTITALPYRKEHGASKEDLFTCLKDSVKHHLIADVPVGLFYSGGIDSTLIAVILKELGVSLTAHHISFTERSDTYYAREIQKRLGLTVRETIVTADAIEASFESLMDRMDQPLADTSLLPTLLVSQSAAQESKVVLSGEGGDELFAGYTRHRRLMGFSFDVDHLANNHLLLGLYHSLLAKLPRSISFLPSMRGVFRRSSPASLNAYFSETAIGQGIMVPSADLTRRIAHRLKEREIPDGPLSFDRLIYLPDNLLQKIDTATMAYSIEGRVPFLDREVFAAVAATPLEWKRKGVEGKLPLKRILEKYLPHELIYRSKSGFSLPLSSFVLSKKKQLIDESVSWYLSAYRGLEPTFDAVVEYARQSASRDDIYKLFGHSLYALVTLFLFVNRIRS